MFPGRDCQTEHVDRLKRFYGFPVGHPYASSGPGRAQAARATGLAGDPDLRNHVIRATGGYQERAHGTQVFECGIAVARPVREEMDDAAPTPFFRLFIA